jgi:hypothetical protein
MAETEETFSDVVGFGSPDLHDAPGHVLQWNTYEAAPHAGPALKDTLWTTQVADAARFTDRWVWKYGMNVSHATGKAMSRIDRSTRARKERVLVLGNGPLADRIVAALQNHPSYECIGHLHK